MVLMVREWPEYAVYLRLFQCTYTFLLRLPSECLPLVVGPTTAKCPVVTATEEGVTLVLPRRKNKVCIVAWVWALPGRLVPLHGRRRAAD